MKKEVEIVRMEPLQTRRPEVIIRGKTRQAVAKKAGEGVRRGQYGGVSEILYTNSGYVAKAWLIERPEPKHRNPKEPLPMWVRILVRIGWSLAGLVVAAAILTFALASLFGALVNIPWMSVLGVLGVILLICLATSPGRAAVSVIVKVIVH